MIRIDVTISEIMDLCRSLSSIDSYTKNQVDEILKDIHVNKNLINRTINQLTDLDIKAVQLMSLLIEKKEQVEGLIASTEIVLLNTPKEISETHYDDNGDLYTITKPNPEYAKLLEELRNYKLELWGIENRIESCKSVQQRISSYSQKLSNALYSIKYYENKIKIEESSISNSISIAMRQLSKYQGLVEQYCKKSFIFKE